MCWSVTLSLHVRYLSWSKVLPFELNPLYNIINIHYWTVRTQYRINYNFSVTFKHGIMNAYIPSNSSVPCKIIGYHKKVIQIKVFLVRAFTVRKLKIITFSNLKSNFIYFNNLLYKTPNIKATIPSLLWELLRLLKNNKITKRKKFDIQWQ